MTVAALLCISDGRHEYHHRSLASALEHLPTLDHYLFVDDPDHQLGFSGAIAEGWERVLATDAAYVVHWEADFTLNEPMPVRQMVGALERDPKLAQVSLKRQPVNGEECAAGGFVEAHPERYEERRLPAGLAFGQPLATITEHRVCFSTNPSVYPRAIVERSWPQVEHSEGIFTHQLLADGYRFAIWGGKFDPPLVEHIGAARAGTGY